MLETYGLEVHPATIRLWEIHRDSLEGWLRGDLNVTLGHAVKELDEHTRGRVVIDFIYILANAQRRLDEQLLPDPDCVSGVHAYLSTACQHKLCDQCRLECKYCQAKCLCDHHKEGGSGQETIVEHGL